MFACNRVLQIPLLRRWTHPKGEPNGLYLGGATYQAQRNAELTAMLMGHTNTKMLFRNYRKRVSPEAAQAWFSIFPPGHQPEIRS